MELRRRRLCLVCSDRVAKRSTGKPARYCSRHLRYYAARAAAVALVALLLPGCGDAFAGNTDSAAGTGGAVSGSPSVAGSGAASAGGAVSVAGEGGVAGIVQQPVGQGGAGGELEQGGAGGELEQGGAGGEPSSSVGPCSREGWTLTAFASAELEPPALALDGDTVTRWSSGQDRAAGQWLALELGAPLELVALELVAPSSDQPSAPGGLLLELDGVATPATLAPMEGGVRLTFDGPPASSARLELAGAGDSWWSVRELGAVCRK